jgi:ABC-type uncharacterized transport system substrate-binding protein
MKRAAAPLILVAVMLLAVAVIARRSSSADAYRSAAVYIDKTLQIFPVELPTKVEFIVNLKIAKQIGITLPAERADES